jgi:hydroxyacylglutathione hydrolase
MSLTVVAIPCLSDNYAWLLRDDASGATAVVDPAEPASAIAAVERAGGRLDLILLTHHHGDHVDGVPGLKARFPAPVVGAAADARRLPPLDRAVATGEMVALGQARAEVLDTPGHTRGHIAYFFGAAAVLCCGDTLFSLGCGRLLEGSAEEMFDSLRQLAALPPETLICCGHEYTESNARYALHVDPDNPALRARAAEVARLRASGQPTVPVRLSDELATNPFLRAPNAARFAELRKGKDTFR